MVEKLTTNERDLLACVLESSACLKEVAFTSIHASLIDFVGLKGEIKSLRLISDKMCISESLSFNFLHSIERTEIVVYRLCTCYHELI